MYVRIIYTQTVCTTYDSLKYMLQLFILTDKKIFLLLKIISLLINISLIN